MTEVDEVVVSMHADADNVFFLCEPVAVDMADESAGFQRVLPYTLRRGAPYVAIVALNDIVHHLVRELLAAGEASNFS